jgi:hypothetical protein
MQQRFLDSSMASPVMASHGHGQPRHGQHLHGQSLYCRSSMQQVILVGGSVSRQVCQFHHG